MLGAVAVDEATQTATFSHTPNDVGTHQITAEYGGRDATGGLCVAASDTFELTVTAATSDLTDLTADPASLETGATTVLSATVQCTASPTGELVFSHDGDTIGRADIDPASGAGSIDYTPSEAGNTPVAVTFDSDDDTCSGATGEIALRVAAPVAYEPEAAVSPGSVTVSELAADGVTIAGEGFAPGSTVTLTVAGEDIDAVEADANGTVEFTYLSDTLGTGEHTVVLTAGEWSAEASFTVTAVRDVDGPGDQEEAPATDEGGTDTQPPGESGDERGLPATGAAGVGLLATIAALLFVVGWAQVLLRRRRVME